MFSFPNLVEALRKMLLELTDIVMDILEDMYQN
jgi:hypothetical protein